MTVLQKIKYPEEKLTPKILFTLVRLFAPLSYRKEAIYLLINSRATEKTKVAVEILIGGFGYRATKIKTGIVSALKRDENGPQTRNLSLTRPNSLVKQPLTGMKRLIRKLLFKVLHFTDHRLGSNDQQ